MTIEEARIRLRNKLEDMLGVEETSILMDRPPGGWGELATDRSLDALEARIDRRFDELDRRFSDIDRRFADVDRRFSEIETNIMLRLDSALNAAFTKQTKWLFSALVVFGALIVGALRI